MTDPPKRRGRPPSGGREAILAATLELLRERGIANLNSREVAARAGVSDASVYYHFRDRAGLLQAVFEAGMQPLAYLSTLADDQRDVLEVLADAAEALESFFDEALPVMLASQSDPELRDAMAAHLRKRQLGPHRGVAALGGYLRRAQSAGRIPADVDVDAIAMMLIDSCLGRAMRKQMLPTSGVQLPSQDQIVVTLSRLLGERNPARH
jgi:AcrR family transcriptional regulator